MPTTVFLLWHTHHDAADPAEHRQLVNEAADGDVKLLGVYSSVERARDAQEAAARLEGFRDERDCFEIAEYELDKAYWVDGFRSAAG